MKGKLQILVCDYVGNSQQWLENFTIPKNYEVVGTITPQSDKKLILENSWDYLLIFEQDARQFFDSMVKFMNIAAERVIYAFEILSWTTHPTAAYSIVNPNEKGGGVFIAL